MRKYVVIAGMACALSACGTSPEPDYFSLAKIQGAPASQTVAIIKIERPDIAGYLDRPDFVRQSGDYQIKIDETANWAEPLDEMFARILAADLQQRLPSSLVVSQDDLTPPNTRFTVDMTLERFNATDWGHVSLQGDLVIADKDAQAQPQAVPVTLTVAAGSSPSSVAAGLSELTAQLADKIAQNIAAFPPR